MTARIPPRRTEAGELVVYRRRTYIVVGRAPADYLAIEDAETQRLRYVSPRACLDVDGRRCR